MDHGRNCPALGAIGDDGCTCGLRYRIELQTEREMHNAWRKRAEEAEAITSEKRVTILQQRATELVTKIDEALALVPQSTDGVEVAAGDMLLLGPEISDLLREVAGLPAYVR